MSCLHGNLLLPTPQPRGRPRSASADTASSSHTKPPLMTSMHGRPGWPDTRSMRSGTTQRGDDHHRLLCVIGAVTKTVGRRGHQLRASEPPVDPARSVAAQQPHQTQDKEQPEHQSELPTGRGSAAVLARSIGLTVFRTISARQRTSFGTVRQCDPHGSDKTRPDAHDRAQARAETKRLESSADSRIDPSCSNRPQASDRFHIRDQSRLLVDWTGERARDRAA